LLSLARVKAGSGGEGAGRPANPFSPRISKVTHKIIYSAHL